MTRAKLLKLLVDLGVPSDNIPVIKESTVVWPTLKAR
jgi:hypothetical protein